MSAISWKKSFLSEDIFSEKNVSCIIKVDMHKKCLTFLKTEISLISDSTIFFSFGISSGKKNEEEVEVRLHSMIFQIQFSHSKKFGLQQALKLFMLLLLNKYLITEIDKLASIKITCRNCLKKKTTAFHSIGFHWGPKIGSLTRDLNDAESCASGTIFESHYLAFVF